MLNSYKLVSGEESVCTRRAAIALATGVTCRFIEHAAAAAVPVTIDLDSIPREVHERFMRMAITHARRNPRYPFGAVIARAANARLMASGVNDTKRNPILHGEIVAMNDYVLTHGNRDWGSMILYTTAEPCPMCMSAMIRARIGGVVFGTSIAELLHVGFEQIEITAASVIRAAPFYYGALLGGVLAAETDRMFAEVPSQKWW
jgi:tRNA(adenine34) deaminase